MSNPFLDRAERKAKQPKAYHRAPRQEKDLSKRFNGYQISGSGRGKKKGDLYRPNVVRVEAKTTQRNSFSVTRDMVNTITHASLASDEMPVIIVEFLDERGKPTHELAIMQVSHLEALIATCK
jgi:hypothetical protein